MSKDGNIFQRVEKKYKLTPSEFEAFMEYASDRIHMDEFGLHTINNIYFDTEQYDLIRTSIEKPKYKEKFRVRGYGNVQAGDPVFLEIKKKYAGIVYKRRICVPYNEAKAFLEGREMLKSRDQISREITYFFSFYHPVPKLFLAYDRMAFVGNEDSELRITFDRNIRSRQTQLDLCMGSAGTILDGRNYLMEIKVAGAYPLWLTKLLSDMEIYPVSFSKYGTIYKDALENERLTIPIAETMKLRQENKQKEEEITSCLQAY